MLPYTIQNSLEDARRTARERELRERVTCYITRARRDVLVFEHDDRYPEAGVQIPAGGVDPGETLEQAAAREAREETGLEHLSAPVYLGSALHEWSPPQMQHYFWLEAENTAPDAWDHFAEGQYTFHHRFEPIPDAVIHWGLDAFIPELERRLNLPGTPSRNNAVPVAVCYITRVRDGVPELLILHGHPDGGVQVVAGGVDDGETPDQAAIREAWEEAGLRLEHPVFLGRAEYHFKGVHPDTSEPLEMHEDRYFYHFNTTEARDSWDHVVSAGEDDSGKVFHHQFVKLEDVRLDWDLGTKTASVLKEIWKANLAREWFHEGFLRYEKKFLTVIEQVEVAGNIDLSEAKHYVEHSEPGLAYAYLCYKLIATNQKYFSTLIDSILELGSGFDYESGVFQDGDLEYFEYALNEMRLTDKASS